MVMNRRMVFVQGRNTPEGCDEKKKKVEKVRQGGQIGEERTRWKYTCSTKEQRGCQWHCELVNQAVLGLVHR
jgi:hypothetical protein